jgi:hypothetical protein
MHAFKQDRCNSLLDSKSLLMVVNLVLSWFSRSSTTAASSAELSVLVLKPGDCCDLASYEEWVKMCAPVRRWTRRAVEEGRSL